MAKAAESQSRRKPPRRPRRKANAPSPLAVEADLFRRRHGSKLGMRYACHRCEGPIAESMTYCPWCGSPDNSFREITSYPLVCPVCEHGVRAEWNACPWCYAGRLEGNGRAPREDPKAERSCSNRECDGQLQPFMRYCPLCKTKPRPFGVPSQHSTLVPGHGQRFSCGVVCIVSQSSLVLWLA